MQLNLLSGFFNGDKRTNLLKKNIVASITIKFISIITSLLLVPLCLGYLNQQLYGLWLTLSSIILSMNYFDIGFTLGLKNKLTEALATNDYDKGKRYVSTTYYMMLLILIPLTTILCLIIPIIDWPALLNVDAIYKEQIIDVLYLLTIFMAFQMFFNVLGSIVTACQKTALSSLFFTLGQVLSLAIVWALKTYTQSSLLYLALGISISPVIVLVISSIILFKGSLKKIAPGIHFIETTKIKDLFGMGIKFFIIQMQIIVLYNSTNLIISHISGPDAVSQYQIAYKFLGVATMIFHLILTPVWPAFTDAYTLKDYRWMKNIYRKMLYIYIFVFFAVIMLTCLSSFVYRIWLKGEIVIPFEITLFTAIFVIINSWDAMQVAMINGVGAVKLQTVIVLIGLICHIPLALFIGSKIGTQGVILSMIIINCIYSIVFTIQINRIIRQSKNKIWY